MLRFLRKYKGILSISLAALVIGGVYLAAWLPVFGEGFQISIEKEWGRPSALGGFSLTGSVTDGRSETIFTLNQAGLSQKSRAIPPETAEEDHTAFSQKAYYLPGEVMWEELIAVPNEEEYNYQLTQRTWSEDTQLIWEIKRLHFSTQFDCQVRLNTGLTYPKSECLLKSSSAMFDPAPSDEEIREFLEPNEFSPTKDLLDTVFGVSSPLLESVAEVNGALYFVPTVSQEWEGTRYIYRVDQSEKWPDTAFLDASEPIGQATPVIEVQRGRDLDIWGLYATLDGTLVLIGEYQGTPLFQMYEPETGEMMGEVTAPGLYLSDQSSFLFFPQENGFCAGFADWETETSTLVSMRNDIAWRKIQPVRQVPFYLEHAVSDGENLAAIGSKRQILRTKDVVCGAVWDQDGLAYQVHLSTPIQQDEKYEGGEHRSLSGLQVERRNPHD